MKAIVVATALASAALPLHAHEPIVKSSPFSVTETVDRLVAVVEGAGAKVMARVDHGAGAASVGNDLRPTQVLIFGNPKLGSPVMQAAQSAGLDLPQRVLVMEDADRNVTLRYYPAAHIGELHGLPEDHPQLKKISGALDKLTEAAVSP